MNFCVDRLFPAPEPMAIYSAAKAAVAGFTQSLAVELRDRQIRVDAVAPGMVRTGDNVATAGDAAEYVELRDIPTASCHWPGPPPLPDTSFRSLRAAAARVDGAREPRRPRDGRRPQAGPGLRAGAGGTRHGRGHSPSRLGPGAEELRREIEAAGGRAMCFAADLSDAAAAIALPKRVIDGFGRLDVLVNSAAVMHRLSFEETTPAQWDAIMALNLRAAFFCAQGAAALRRRGSNIVNIAEVDHRRPA